MLTPEDIKLIGVEVGNVIDQNIMSQFDDFRSEMRHGFEAVDRRFDSVERRLDRVDSKVNTLTNVLSDTRVITEVDKRQILS